MSALPEIELSWKDPKEPLRSYFEQAPVGLAECRYAGTIKSFNPALVRLLGAPLDLRRPVALAGLIDAKDRDEAEHELADLFEGRRQSVQIDSQAKGRERVCLRWTAWRVPGNHGDSGSVLAMAEELPRDAALGRQLEQAAKLESVGKLAGGVAHDFNNILTGILLHCDLLMAGLDPGHRARKYAEEIRDAGMQASGLVRQLLAISCRSTLQPQPLSLNEIAAAMRNLLMRLVGGNIQLNFHLDPKLGLTKLDPTQAHSAEPGAQCSRCNAQRWPDRCRNPQLPIAVIHGFAVERERPDFIPLCAVRDRGQRGRHGRVDASAHF